MPAVTASASSRPAAAPSSARAVARPRAMQTLLGLLALLACATLAAAASGAVDIPWTALPRLLFGDAATPDEMLWHSVLWQVRLPRVLFAIVCGGGLALAGVAMQALFRNPLAEPGLIGISAGGSLGAVAAIVLGFQQFTVLAPAAFVGALGATLLAYRLGRMQQGMASLLLAGVAINAICWALIGLFTYLADDTQLRSLTFWNLGSLAGASWPLLAFLGPWTLLMSVLLLRHWRAMNALLLGEREAQHLGFALRPLRRRMVILTALLVGPLVAATGTIGFIGLVVPHLVRLTLGADHRWLLPNALVAGALALTLADWLARIVVIPSELPIGIVTALVGGPFFLWLLTRGGAR
ncbi:FecCD family ABC transporter permease [Chitiniphilus shinanonensis]